MIIDFKIGMVAPSGVGKTSLLAAIYNEVQERTRREHSFDFCSANPVTSSMMTNAQATFNTCINSPNDLFVIPQFKSTENETEYSFSIVIHSAECPEIHFSIMDYPGGSLGQDKFARNVMPHLNDSVALLVPVSADIVMDWVKTQTRQDSFSKDRNIAANKMMEQDKVSNVIKKWLNRKIQQNQSAQLIFVPIKCEKYFDDNGGNADDSKRLQEAIEHLYINDIRKKMTPEERKLIQISIFNVDTYGIVELLDIVDEQVNGQMVLKSTFTRRTNMGRETKPKNAYELLVNILRFQISTEHHKQEEEKNIDEHKCEKCKQAVEDEKSKRDNINQEILQRKQKYTLLERVYYTFAEDTKLKNLEKEKQEHSEKCERLRMESEESKELAGQSNAKLKSISDTENILSKLYQEMPNRQIVIN